MSSIFGVSRRGLAGFGFLTLRRRPALGIPKIGELRHAGKGLFREAGTNAQWAAPLTVWITVFALWFKGGHFFATGDVTPWVRNGLRAEIGSLWTHQNTGAGGTTYEIGRVVELLFIRLGELLGGGAPLGQRLFFASIFAFAAYGGSLFGRRMGRRSATVFLSGLLAAFNPYFLFYLPNFLPVIVLGIVSVALALAMNAAEGGRARWLALAVTTVPLAYVSVNPPLVGLVGICLLFLAPVAAGLTGTGWQGFQRAIRMEAKAALVALLLALWWAVPMMLALRQASHSGSIGAELNVANWSWTHRNNSIANILTFRHEWTWPNPFYHGLAARWLTHQPFSLLPWLLPLTVVAANLFAPPRRRRAARWLAVYLPLHAFIAKGLHAPFAGGNLFLYRHVPGMWLFREPAGKLALLLVLAYVASFALAVEGLLNSALLSKRYWAKLGWCVAAALAIGPLVYTWPLSSGLALRDADNGHTEQVAVPQGWYDVAKVVNNSPLVGKAIALPLIDFYQIPTTWGFYGADNLVRQLVKRPVAARSPDTYVTDNQAYESIMTWNFR